MAFSTSWLRQASLYKFRYIIGYGVIIVVLFFIVGADVGTLPDGLSHAEMNQAVTSLHMHPSLDFSWTINAPYNAIQKLSVEAFGLTRLSLVLPSFIFGALTVIAFVLTMKHWFRDSVAVVSTIIAMSSVPFISMLRSATPEIMVPFWTVLLLYGAVRLLVKRDHAFHWKLLIVIAILGLLYTPYGVYPLAAIFGSALLHPHVLSRLRHIKRVRIIILSVVVFVGILPLGVYIATHPHDALNLIGWDTVRDSLEHMRKNISVIYDMYFNVSKNGFAATQIVPVFNLATLALVCLGIFKSLRDRYTARSYVLLTLAFVTLLDILFLPSVVSLVFMPMALLVAIGIDTLIVEWYSLFPRNPYARVAGLIPLTILFIGIASGNISHYFNNYNHIPNQFYTQSLSAIRQSLVIEGNHQVILVTSQQDLAFYSLLKREHPLLTVTTSLPADASTPTFILPNSNLSFAVAPSRILTSATKDNSVALRIYRPQ